MSAPAVEREPTRIGIVGAGAMGLSLAAALGRIATVAVVCRDADRAARVIRDGAVTRGVLEMRSRPIVLRRCSDLPLIGGVGVVFVATKTTAIDSVAADLAPLLPTLGDSAGAPFVVSFQNGIEPGRRLMERLGDPRVLRMVLNYSAHLAPDGVVEIMHSDPPHWIGSPNAAHLGVCGSIASLLTRAGLETRTAEDIEPMVWSKGLINAAMSPVAALVNASVGEVLDSPARSIVMRLLDEGLAVASAERIDLGAGARERLWAALERARDHVPSMVEDIRAGRESEVGQLNRQIIAHARRATVAVPAHELIESLIEAFDWRVFERSAGRSE